MTTQPGSGNTTDTGTATASQLAKKVMAEFIGTFALVFMGCGAIVVDSMRGGVISHPGISLVFGGTVMVMIYATGHISGAHFNPAVTVAFAASRRFSWREVPAYVGGQCLAALCAALCLSLLLDPQTGVGATTPGIEVAPALAVEAILTFFLMFVIIAVATDYRAVGQLAGVAIGGTVTMGALVGGPLTGASMNPARSLGPAIVQGEFTQIAIYLVAPVAGAVLAALLYEKIRCDERPAESAAGCC